MSNLFPVVIYVAHLYFHIIKLIGVMFKQTSFYHLKYVKLSQVIYIEYK